MSLYIIQCIQFSFGKIFQYIIRHTLLTISYRSSYAYSQPPKILCSQLSHDIFQSIVSSRASSKFQSNFRNRKIYLIMDDKNIFRINLIKMSYLLYRSSRTIHIQEWFCYNNLFSIHKTFSYLSSSLFLQTPCSSPLSDQIINNHKTYCMPMFCIVFSWITQSYNEFHNT